MLDLEGHVSPLTVVCERSRAGWIIHCAGCTMHGGAPSPPPTGVPDQLPDFYQAVLTFECLNVQCKQA